MTKYILLVLISWSPLLTLHSQSSIKVDTALKNREVQALKLRINSADLIVEGKVIKTKGFWNKNYSSVFTSNTVVVYKLFKGTLTSDTIEVVGKGGVLTPEDTLYDITVGLSVSNEDPLLSNEEGIFFLKLNRWNIKLKNQYDSYIMWDRYRFRFFYDGINPAATFGYLRFNSVKTEVYPLIQDELHKEFTTLSENPRYKMNKK